MYIPRLVAFEIFLLFTASQHQTLSPFHKLGAVGTKERGSDRDADLHQDLDGPEAAVKL